MSNEVCKNIKISKDKTLNNLSLEPEYNACSIKDKIANNNNVEIIDDKIIGYKEKIYDYRNVNEGSFCNIYGNEKWHDWFFIPYYYIGNNIDGKYVNDTYSVKSCFNYCENGIGTNNLNYCIDIKSYENGRYSNMIKYDPISLICIIGSIQEKSFIHNGVENSGNYYDLLNNINNNYDIITNNTIKNTNITIPNDTKLKHIFNDNITKHILNNIEAGNYEQDSPLFEIYEDIKIAFYSIYNTIIKDSIYRNNQDQNLINKDLADNIDEFYNLLIDDSILLYKDKYLLEKVKGFRIKYANYIVKNITDLAIDSFDYCSIIPELNSISVENKKYINNSFKYLFKYSLNICYFKNSEFSEKLKMLDIIKIDDQIDKEFNLNISNNISTNVKNSYISNTKEIKIEKETINTFQEYDEIFKYYKNVLMLFPFVLGIIASLYIIYMIMQLLGLHYIVLYGINIIFQFFLIIFLALMYIFVYFGIIFMIIIYTPIKWFISKLAIIFTFVIIVIIIFTIDPLKPIGIELGGFAYIIFKYVVIDVITMLLNIVKELIVGFLRVLAVSLPTSLFLIYSFWKIAAEDIDIITNWNISFVYIKRIIDANFDVVRDNFYMNYLDFYKFTIENL